MRHILSAPSCERWSCGSKMGAKLRKTLHHYGTYQTWPLPAAPETLQLCGCILQGVIWSSCLENSWNLIFWIGRPTAPTDFWLSSLIKARVWAAACSRLAVLVVLYEIEVAFSIRNLSISMKSFRCFDSEFSRCSHCHRAKMLDKKTYLPFVSQ